MSKPKPGLGKGLVRSALAASHGHGHGHGGLYSSHSSTSGASSSSSSSTSSLSASFGSLSLTPGTIGYQNHTYPPNRTGSGSGSGSSSSSSNTATPSASTSTSTSLFNVPIWDHNIGDIVLPYRSPGHSLRHLSTSRNNGRGSTSRKYTTPSIPIRDSAPSYLSFPSIPPSLLFEYIIPPKSKNISPDLSSGYFSSPPPPPPPGRGSPPLSHQPYRPSSSQTLFSPFPVPSSSTSSNGISLTAYPYSAISDLPPTSSNKGISTDPTESLSHTYTSDLIFRYGASGLPKERIAIPRSLSGGSTPPTPPPRPRSFALPTDISSPKELISIGVGEDAYFTRGDSMCVADGVGGWAKYGGKGGADAGRWSRLLTHFCEREVDKWWSGDIYYLEDVNPVPSSGSEDVDGSGLVVEDNTRGWAGRLWKTKEATSGLGISGVKETDVQDREGLPVGKKRRKLDPVEIMQRGFEMSLACVLAEGIHGSSTCLLALLHHNSLLVANLGDCCLLLIRRGEVVFRTSEMQHAFNFPLQLGTHSRDEPMKDAKRYSVPIEKEDVVIVGSDGLMDNLFDEDILEILSEFSPPTFEFTPTPQQPTPPPSRPSSRAGLPPFNPQKVSEALCKRARQVSELTTATTPFMVRAIEEGIDFVGGKKDDISVLVGIIGERRAEEGKGLTIQTR